MKKRKLLSILLALAMVFALLPQFALPAFAASDASTIDVSDTSPSTLPTGVTYAGKVFTVGIGANGSAITVTGTTTANTIAVATGVTGVTLMLNNLSITNPSNGKSPIDLQGTADVTLQLAAGTTNGLYACGTDTAGICTNGTATLTISGTGTVNTNGGTNGAGIGGGNGGAGGTITISDGTVYAVGGANGAGIGGGNGGAGGTITISGGTVNANSGANGAGIGGGNGGAGGTITISGGTVNAASSGGAGIGGNGGAGGTIAISGGTTIAQSWTLAAISVAPTLSNGATVRVASKNRDGSSPETAYSADAISTYKYLKIAPDYSLSNHTITDYNGAGGDITIPSEINGQAVTAIGADAFQGNKTITTIIVPDGVTAIGDSAFSNCNGLKSVQLPDSVTSMGNYVFAGDSLETVKLPAGLTAIPDHTFIDSGLKHIIIPDTVKSIGESAFYCCTSLAELKLPSKLTTIGNYAFYWCDSFQGIVIPEGVTSIGDGAFQGQVGNLQKAVFMGTTAPALGTGVFANAHPGFTVYYPSGATGYANPWNGYTTAAFDPSAAYSVTYDANGAGSGSTTGDSGLKFGDYAAAAANGFTKSGAVFYGWNTAADGIGRWYWPDDKLLITGNVTLYAQWEYPVTAAACAHGTVSSDTTNARAGDTIDVSVSADTGYHLKDGSVKYTDNTGDHEIAEKSTEDGVVYSFTMPASAVTISAEFEEGDYSFDKATGTITGYNGKGGNIVIPSAIDGVTVKYIGDEAFCDDEDISGVVIPEGVLRIGDSAFSGCTKIKGVTLPGTLESIGVDAFYGCNALGCVKIPGGVTNIGNYAFYNCNNLSLARFEGDAPATCGTNIFTNTAAGFKILYHNGSKNFGAAVLSGYSGAAIESADGAAAVAADLSVVDIVYAFSDNKDSVTNNLYLTVTGAVYGSDITWSSNNTEVISNSGIVTRPAYARGDADVTVTASVYNNGVSHTKDFALKVLKLPASTYTVTFDLAGGTRTGGGELTQIVAQGGSAAAPTATRSGYTFNGWDKDFSNVTASMTVTARWTVILSGGGGSSSGGGGGSTQSTTVQVTITEAASSVTGTTTITAKSDSSGKAAAAITESQVKEAVSKTVDAAAKKGEDTLAKVEIKVTAPAAAKTVEVSLPIAAAAAAADSKIDNLTVASPVASITFDKAAITTISKEAEADVKIIVSKVDAASLSEAAKAVVGDRPVFNFSVTSGDKTISRFGGTVTLSVPYTPKAGEDINAIVIYYINVEGKPEVVSRCAYDPATGTINFITNHFSVYAVGYNKVSFKDVAANAWYSSAVSFVAARGITTGTGDGKYSPEDKLTRGQFMVMVMRAYGMKADENLKDNFADSGNTYYTGYLAAAKRLGISGGIGNNMFAPDKEITRQEMFALLYNVLKAVGELPQGTEGKTLSSFSDANNVAAWAKDAMTLFVKTGTISGSGGKLAPASTTTRAEMAQVLYNLMGK